MAKSLLKKKYSLISTSRNSRDLNLSAFPTYSPHCAYQQICCPCTKISLKRVSQISSVTRSHTILGPEPCSWMLRNCVAYQSIRLCVKRGSGCLLPLPLLGVSPKPSAELGSSSSPSSPAPCRGGSSAD